MPDAKKRRRLLSKPMRTADCTSVSDAKFCPLAFSSSAQEDDNYSLGAKLKNETPVL